MAIEPVPVHRSAHVPGLPSGSSPVGPVYYASADAGESDGFELFRLAGVVVKA
jgi:hypothetical protein